MEAFGEITGLLLTFKFVIIRYALLFLGDGKYLADVVFFHSSAEYYSIKGAAIHIKKF